MVNKYNNAQDSFQIFLAERNIPDPDEMLGKALKYLRDKGQNYLLTMSQNYTMPELSYIMTNVTGKEIGYSPVTVKRFAEIYATEGDGKELASMYQAAAMGLMDKVTNDFAHITGHEPTDMEEFLNKNY